MLRCSGRARGNDGLNRPHRRGGASASRRSEHAHGDRDSYRSRNASEAEGTEYEQAITGGRFGLSHREIATAAEVSHGTVRAILACGSTSLDGNDRQTVTAAVAAIDARQGAS